MRLKNQSTTLLCDLHWKIYGITNGLEYNARPLAFIETLEVHFELRQPLLQNKYIKCPLMIFAFIYTKKSGLETINHNCNKEFDMGKNRIKIM